MQEEVKGVMQTEKEEERTNRGKEKRGRQLGKTRWYPSRDPDEIQVRSEEIQCGEKENGQVRWV